jgi:UPF0755 protein
MKRRRSRRQWWALGGIVALALLLIGSYVVYRVGLLPAAETGSAQNFQIKSGESVPNIATNLHEAGLIRSRNAFISYLNFHNLRSKIKAGTYSLAPTMPAPQIADLLAVGKTLSTQIVIPEGYRLSQIRKLVGEYGITGADFDAAVKAAYSYPFLASKPATANLEGYLFPDSYEIGATTTAATLVQTMLTTFGERVGEEYVTAFSAQGLNLHQAVTLASLVEKEVSIEADRPVVAQIFLKRYRMGMALGSDVTTAYAAELAGVPFNLDINSPYNTRKFVGLPPGPISSPGLSALDAVARPAKTDYLYFISGADNKTYYGKTYAEHEANIRRHGLAGGAHR